MKWIIREQQKKESAFNAGSKARNDVDAILIAEGYKPLIANSELDESQESVKKICLQFTRFLEWKRCFSKLKRGDTVVIQYPVRNHTLFFGNALKMVEKKGVKIIGILHDLESLRLAISENSPVISKIRFKIEEISALKFFSFIIVHNEHMKKAIHNYFNIPMEKMVNLDIFDYLYNPEVEEEHAIFGGSILIAGNLDKNKCGYIYDLPKDVQFDLYGANYDNNISQGDNIHYMGKAKPDDLPNRLRGSFGLVWDGPVTNTCDGIYGEYLKYNNPHKASLYLAAGLPIIVWRQSALSDFVILHGCGIMVDDLNMLELELTNLSLEDYGKMAYSAAEIGKNIRKGSYLRKAVRGLLY